jgi:hypothetical protein
MLIGPASSVTTWLASQLGGLGSSNQSITANTSGLTSPSASGPSGTVMQALSQVGVNVSGAAAGTSAPGATSSTQNEAQALQAFMQNLFAALQAQGVSATATSTPTAATTTPSTGAVTGHKGGHGHGHGHMEQEVQGLIQDLGSSSSTTSSSTSSSALAPLQQSFQNLVTASGSTPSTPTLSGFLTAFQNDLPNMGMVGNLLNAHA